MPRDKEQARELKKRAKEKHKLQALMRDFNKEILGRVFSKVDEGYEGWNSEELKEKMKNDLVIKSHKLYKDPELKDYVDIAAYAAFLWNLKLREE